MSLNKIKIYINVVIIISIFYFQQFIVSDVIINVMAGIFSLILGGLFILDVKNSKYTRNNVLLVIYGVWIFVFLKDPKIILLVMSGFILSNIDGEKYKPFLNVSLFMFVLTIFIGLYGGKELYHIDGRYGERLMLGFNNPNHLSLYFYNILLFILLLSKNKKIMSIFVFFVTMFFFRLTISRTMIVSASFLLIYVFSNISLYKKSIYLITKNIVVILFIISLLLIQFHNNEVLNSISASRLSLWYNHISEVGFSIVGKVINEESPLDNEYLKMYASYGIVGLLIFDNIWRKTVDTLYVRDEEIKILIMFVMAIYVLFERVMLNPANICIAIIIITYSKEKNKGNE